MARRFLVALVVAVGLAGCGGGAEDAKENGATQLQDVTITRNPDSTFTVKTKDKTINDISSVQVNDPQQSSEVHQFLAPVGSQKNLCCDSCSLSGGVLICTGCTAC